MILGFKNVSTRLHIEDDGTVHKSACKGFVQQANKKL